jgi:hypothetical protein
MKRTNARNLGVVLALAVTLACHAQLTPVGNVANIAGEIVQSADTMVKTAASLHASVPTVMTDNRLAAVAIAGDKIGREGQDLQAALTAYNAMKAAGSNTVQQAQGINTLLAAITQALSDVGMQIPNGTLSQIDQAVATIVGLVAQIRAGVGL